MICPERIGHVVLKVRDLERTKKFYAEVMGLEVMKVEPSIKMAFFASNGRDHHEIAAIEIDGNIPDSQAGGFGLSHLAFRLRDEAHLRAAYTDLKEHEVKIISAVNHGVTKSIYFRDPDGHLLEVYCDGLPEELAKFPDPYMGMGALDFAKDAPDFMEAFGELSK
ncbi:MAG TPA: VOC family protein [Candidatus Binataceae bacterium]|jgi:catechol 2,3-dioxygenase|nr:VOC family protein [Candidatus Binataceae bacterium]